jgi:DNA (cytosine-5)-methyltransferase 1
MTHGSLFSGIGGFDLAAEWMGWENIFHCEWNPFGQKVLKYYWPNAISYENICTTDFTVHRGKVDIITGGFPCQPYSTAGKRLGKADERHLFPEMLRCIKEIKPRWIIGENVRGLVSWNGGMVFHEVYNDLEREGYEVQSFLIPAASVNAPHRRDRIWFVAYANNKGRSDGFGQIQGKNGKISEWHNNAESCNTDNEFIAYPKCTGLEHGDKARNLRSEETKTYGKRSEFANELEANGNGKWNITDTNCEMLEYRNGCREKGWNNKEVGIKSFNSPRKWETFPTVSPICNGNDGLPNKLDGITFPKWRKESIKAGGNAIVPQVAYQIFKTIESYERSRITEKDR